MIGIQSERNAIIEADEPTAFIKEYKIINYKNNFFFKYWAYPKKAIADGDESSPSISTRYAYHFVQNSIDAIKDLYCSFELPQAKESETMNGIQCENIETVQHHCY